MGEKIKEWMTYWDGMDGEVKVILLMFYVAVIWEVVSMYFNAMERKRNAWNRKH